LSSLFETTNAIAFLAVD